MIGGEIIYTESVKEFGIMTAQKMVSIISKTIDEYGKCFLAVSGGRTPLPIYDILKSKNYQQILDWSKVHVFFTDERCVSKEDGENNYKSCYDSWLKFFPTINSYRIKGWLNPEEAALKYEDKIKSVLNKENGFPQFDLIFMGIGNDGHIASLFPDYDFNNKDQGLVKYVVVDSEIQDRISMTIPLLNNAKNRIFGIIGDSKKKIYSELLSSKNTNYPVSHLLSSDAKDLWVLQ